MLRVTVCIGSSCHLKGSRQVVEALQSFIDTHQLQDKVELSGKFCMGNCKNGVSVLLNEDLFSLTPETVEAFCQSHILESL